MYFCIMDIIGGDIELWILGRKRVAHGYHQEVGSLKKSFFGIIKRFFFLYLHDDATACVRQIQVLSLK